MPFTPHEYQAAFGEFVGNVVRELARARDPVLQKMSFERTTSTTGSRVQSRDGLNVELEPSIVGFGITFSDDEIRHFDYTAFMLQADSASEELAKGMMKMWVESMDKLTEGTGNVIDAGGPLTFEVFYEMLEAIDWPDLDADGNQVMPEIVGGRDVVGRILALPEPTPDQQAKLDEQKQRKYEESRARRRSRRLS